MPICIAGMHRSGTSMVARLLNLCGVYLGEPNEILGPLPDNLDGHWENALFGSLNDRILTLLGGGWDLPPVAKQGWELSQELGVVRDEALRLVERFSLHAAWGWKDPRNSLTLPFWRALLPDMKVVICLRDPLAVAESLRKRGSSSLAFGLQLWLTYNQHLLSVARCKDCVITHYDAYFLDPQAELRRMLGLLGMPVSDETISQACSIIQGSLRHNRARVDDLHLAGISGSVYELYALICAEAGPVCKAALQAGPLTDSASGNPHRTTEANEQAMTHLQRLETLVVDKERTIQSLSARVADIMAQRDDLVAELTTIQSSKWWRLARAYWDTVSRLRAVRRRVIPLAARRRLAQVRQWVKASVYWPRSDRTRLIPPGQGLDVLCFPIIDWDFRIQRPQQLLRRFAEHGQRVFYVSTRLTGMRRQVRMRPICERVYELVVPGRADAVIYEDCLVGPTLDQALVALQQFVREQDIAEAVCLVQHPFWEPLAAALRAHYGWKVVYDCMDDHSGFATNSPAALAGEANLVANSDLVVATSQRLYQWLSRSNPNCMLVPNGADYHHFANLPSRESSPLAKLPRPVVGYYGAIAEWFDAKAVRVAASLHAEWSFVLIGHTFGADLGPLRGLPNVHLLGEKPYKALPAYLAGFDVCTIPFLRTPLTEASNPVKVFEYLSAGKPVVATALPELEALADVVYCYTTREEFALLLERALAETSPTHAASRQAIAQKNTWDARCSVLKRGIESLYGRAAIIIVTWNNLHLTCRCIESVLADRTWPNMELIIVDNASSDGTVEHLSALAEREPCVKLVLNDRNRGFAAANNLGLRQARDAEFVILLNNDTVVPYGWLCRLLRHARQHEIGMVGPVTNWAGNEARIDVSYRDHRDMPAFARAYVGANDGKVFDIKTLAMYCVAMRRAIVDEVGPLDERFGIGMFEDDDYARRVRQAGYRVICAEDVFVHHHGMASFATMGEAEYRSLFERNRRLYEEKWGEPWEAHQDRNCGRGL